MNKGILAAIGAYTIWGLFPLYWKMLDEVPAIEILGHRMAWSLVFMALVLLIRRDWRWLGSALRDRKLLGLFSMAGILLSVNWLTYIWSVNAGFVVESSLGYFINPLVSVLLGVIFLGERLRRGQVIAVGLATLGVLYLTLNYGNLPWIALVLAFSFGLYGLMKKTAPRNSIQSFTMETILMFFPAFFFLLYQEWTGMGAFGHQGWDTTLLLAGSGAATSIPLLLFGAAAQKIPLSMVGFLQYIAPTLQFLLGVFVYNEPFPLERLIGFSIIWAALLIYSVDGLVNNRQNARKRRREKQESLQVPSQS